MSTPSDDARAALAERFHRIRARIPSSVTLVAVSKTKSADDVEALYRLGQRDFGENYVQELLSKASELQARGCNDIRWHFIGHLQTNKVKSLIPIIHAIHSVDSLRLAEEISKRAAPRKIPCFLEINIDTEPSKSGFPPEDAPDASTQIAGLPGIDLRGLMCIPAPTAEDPRIPFGRLRELEKSCRPSTSGQLSMGMSDDFEIAIAEGSTAVRIGSLIFGPRKTQ
jgi:pyridoxal phosphate enzyme (YggS family)